jgi:hypothetical protein
MQENHKGHPKK